MTNTYSTTLVRASSQCWYVADTASLSITGDLSISMWVKPASTPSAGAAYQLMTKANGTGNQRSYQFLYQDNAGQRQLRWLSSHLGTANDTDVTVNVTDFPTNSWTHVGISVTNGVGASNITFYVNGTSVGTAANATTGIFDSTADFIIGGQGDHTAPNNTWDGKIDQVFIWSQVESSSTFSSLHSDPCNSIGDNATRQGYWQFENNGNDQTSNANNLTNVNSATFTTDPGFTCGTTANGHMLCLTGVGS